MPDFPSEPLPAREQLKESVTKILVRVGAPNVTRRVLIKCLTAEYQIDFSVHRKLLDDLVVEASEIKAMKSVNVRRGDGPACEQLQKYMPSLPLSPTSSIQCIASALALSLPVAAVLAIGLDFDRATVASWASAAFATLLNALFLAPFAVGTPSAGRRASVRARCHSAATIFLVTWSVIALTWELGWLLVHPQLPLMQDSFLGYVWWVYIDAGDRRYLTAPTDLVVMEALSVANALLCAAALTTLLRPTPEHRRQDPRRTIMACVALVAVSAVHLYSTILYYAVELAHGCPSCDWERPLNVVFAFGLANAPWLYMPFLVCVWALDTVADLVVVQPEPRRR